MIIGQSIVIGQTLLPLHPRASVAMTVNEYEPTLVGVPESTPEEERVKPGGNVPAVTEKLYGAEPPLAVIAWLKNEPTVPFGNDAGPKVIVGQFMMSV